MSSTSSSFDAESLLPMDVVVFRNDNVDNNNNKFLGAVQENGRVALLSVWTDEPVFGSSMELVVDEVDLQGYEMNAVVIESVIPQNCLSYGSRQVGGGKGPGNPHGEESELLYYVEQEQLAGLEISVRPHLEILW